MAILVGTASWADPSLIKSKLFYPKDAGSAEGQLRYYATRFPMVEVDSSYYALPSATNAEKWAARTPDGFVFNIKAFRLFTGHQTPRVCLPKDLQGALAGVGGANPNLYYRDVPEEIRDEVWRRYELGIRPLRDAGKLKAVHFQFPHWVQPSTKAIGHFEDIVARMRDYLLAFEFRSLGWFDGKRDAETLALQRRLGVAHVVVDEPQGTVRAIPQVWAVTHPELAIVRLHGRNAETWDIKGATAASDRFTYDYDPAEIATLAAPIRELAAAARDLHVVFNNNYQDQGVRNGSMMMRALGLPRPGAWPGEVLNESGQQVAGGGAPA